MSMHHIFLTLQLINSKIIQLFQSGVNIAPYYRVRTHSRHQILRTISYSACSNPSIKQSKPCPWQSLQSSPQIQRPISITQMHCVIQSKCMFYIIKKGSNRSKSTKFEKLAEPSSNRNTEIMHIIIVIAAIVDFLVKFKGLHQSVNFLLQI